MGAIKKNQVGTLLIKYRFDNQLTQKALATKLKISPMTLSQIENGEKQPDDLMIKSVGKKLGIRF